jgi:hypothetical protein
MTTKELLAYVQGTTPETDKGRVFLVRDSETAEEETVPLPEGCEGFVDEHPEGSDRGGYVPWVKLPSGAGVFYYEPSGEWSVG